MARAIVRAPLLLQLNYHGGFVEMSEFRIAAAQVPSLRGDIDRNIATHLAAMEAAAEQEVSVLVFPELSLTGYEPELAAELAITDADPRLAPLRELARQYRLDTVLGAPLDIGAEKPVVGAIWINANGDTRSYGKMHLGSREPPFFTRGNVPLSFDARGQTIGISICADNSQPSHPEAYANAGAGIYAAGVFLNAEWYAADARRLADYAARFGLLVVMANHAASVGTLTSVGRSAAWAPGGSLLAHAKGVESALLTARSSAGTWRGDVIPL